MTLPLQHVMDADMKGLSGTCCIVLLLIASTHKQLNPAHTGTCNMPQLEH